MDHFFQAANPRFQTFIMQGCSTEKTTSDTPETDYKRTGQFELQMRDERLKNVIGCSVINISFPNVFSNVDTHNNVFAYCWQVAQTPREVTVPVGQYTSAELATAIQTAVNAEETDLKTAYSITAVNTTNVDGKVRFTASHEIYVLTAPRLSRVAGSAGTNAQKATQLAETMGLFGTTLLADDYYYYGSSNATGSHVLTAQGLPQLAGKTSVMLESNLFFHNLARASNTYDALHIPITAAYGASNVFECSSEHQTLVKYSDRRNFGSVYFRLLDRMTREPLDLKGHHLRVTMRIYSFI